MKSFILLVMFSLTFSSFGLLAEIKGPQLQRESVGVKDLQFNTVSNFQFPVTNYGIYYLNLSQENNPYVGGGYWPRGSANQYIFASGFWFGAQKINKQTNEMRKLVAISYNPNSGLSWYTPGRIADGDTAITSLEKKYRIYFSTDFNIDGTSKNGNDGPNWPLWKISDGSNIPYASENSKYISDSNERDVNNNPYGPSYVSDEDIVSIYKDTDLSMYEGGVEFRKGQGYPLRTEVESRIYTWDSDELKDVVVVSYILTNYSTDTLKDCWFGKIVDEDMGTAPMTQGSCSNDHIKYCSSEPDLNLLFAWTELNQNESPDFGYLGCSLLESPTVDEKGFIKKNQLVFPPDKQLGLKSARNWSIQKDKLTDSVRYAFLSENKLDVNDSAGDNRMLLSTGPYNLKPGESCRIALAIIYADPLNKEIYDGSTNDIKNLVDKTRLIRDEYYKGVTIVRAQETISKASLLRAYPNPAQNYINLEATGLDYLIYDINGRSVQQGIDSGKIDISALEKGIYLVLSNDKYYKFVKE